MHSLKGPFLTFIDYLFYSLPVTVTKLTTPIAVVDSSVSLELTLICSINSQLV